MTFEDCLHYEESYSVLVLCGDDRLTPFMQKAPSLLRSTKMRNLRAEKGGAE